MSLQIFLGILLLIVLIGIVLLIIGWVWTGLFLMFAPFLVLIWFINGARS